ncbi:MAG TPA: VWA domain-containing protein [Terracidiphilus sp.]|nr:VWA domain-containing protein [Terracidiphilus sp.]
MVRASALLLASIFFALPAWAAKRVTVAELEQTLDAMHAKSDTDLAWQIAGLELTERLTTKTLARIQNEAPGDKSRAALLALADQSAVLEPPAAEWPLKAAPDIAEQRRIMTLVVDYVHDAVPKLPNFFSTRETTRYEDTPQVETLMGLVPYHPLHFVDRTDSTVLYRNGREVVEAAAARGKSVQPIGAGLTTWGVFGPMLSNVLLDAARSKLMWGHWEQGTAELEAVFNFTVAKEQSHYEVNYCCIASQSATEVAHLQPFKQLVGYHGELAVDPKSGTVSRIIVIADLKPTDPVVKAAIAVEYGPVMIAGTKYVCPVRNVSDTVAQSLQRDPRYAFALARQIQPLMTSVNAVAFENYHVFRSDTRVLTPAEAALAEAEAPPAQPATSADDSQHVVATAATPATAASVANPVDAVPPATQPIAPTVETPELTVAANATLIDTPPQTPLSMGHEFTLRTTSRSVDVTVIAYDKKSNPVTDLKPEDLEIYDNGRRQEIKYFGRGGIPSSSTAVPFRSEATLPGDAPFTNRPIGANHASITTTANTTIFLIDASNVAFGDLTYARSEMLRFLKTLQSDERVALYIMKSYAFQILLEPTTDHAAISSALMKWTPSAQDLARAQDEEQRNRQQVDFVHSLSDMTQLNGNGNTVPETLTSGTNFSATLRPIDPALLSMGSNPGRDALSLILGISRHLAAIPGHKMLVWIASDNVLADWTNQAAPKQEQGSQFIDSFALQAQETLNESHVSIYPVNASQLEAGGIGADLRERNAVPVGMTSRSEALEVLGDAAPGMKPGRITAQMQQDLHPIAGIYRELAAATGGRALRRAGDIATELKQIVADGRAAYQMSFSPDSSADDQYHLITVKLATRRNLSLRYRTGYLYAREPDSLKDRFRQAIWQPGDAAEIGLAATPQLDSQPASIKLQIAGTDLELKSIGERWTDELDVFLVQRNDTTHQIKVTGQSLRMGLKAETYQELMHDGIPFDVALPPNESSDSIRVIVIDKNSGRMGSVTLPSATLKRPS